MEPMRKDAKEEEKEEGMEKDKRKASSSTNDLAPRQVPALQWAMPTLPKFWTRGPSIQVARRRPPSSSRVWVKVPAMQAVPLPLETDKELMWRLKEEEVAVEEVQLGRDAATLEVVLEAASPLMWGQV